MKKIFISYSTKDKWVREWLVPKLEESGIDVQADYKTFLFGKSSLENIELAIENSHHTFFVVTENWHTSEWTELEALILQTESPANRDLKYFVLKREECQIPKRLKPFTYVDLTDDAMVETQINRLLQQINGHHYSKISPKPLQISLHRLPNTSGLLFGREEELKLLDEAWENPNVHVVSFVAQGGEGKTALTRRWVNNMGEDSFRGAERVYVWSFYSQGTSEDRQVSGDLFLAETLTWFGDAGMANSPAAVRQKAQRLADLVRQQKTLLILDGVEPLQYPPGEPHNGRMRDEGVRVLLKELMSSNSGLCVVSTRQEIRELKGGLVLQQPLSPLSTSAGADLLAALLEVKNNPFEIKNRRKDLEQAAQEYHGHALALTLVGNLLREYNHGDIRKRDLIPPLEEEDEWGSHAKRVLASYAKLLEGKPELGILRVMSLFDRPADVAVVNELRKGPSIPAITEALVGLSEMEWKRACKHLHDLGLLEDGDELDCHPLIREHFALELSRVHEEALKEAHGRLCGYYEKLPEKEFPDTREEMEPLFRAIWHACKAALFNHAFHDIYEMRIERGDDFYASYTLGAFDPILSSYWGLYELPWLRVQSQFPIEIQSRLLSFSAIGLGAVGRLRDAIGPMKASLKLEVAMESWVKATIRACNLSDFLNGVGDLKDSLAYARDAVTFSFKRQDLEERVSSYAYVGTALHQLGFMKEAEDNFIEGEAIQGLLNESTTNLYELPGYFYCELLLDLGKNKEARIRAEADLAISTTSQLTLGMAIDNLILGRSAESTSNAEPFIHEAVRLLRDAGYLGMLPLGLLARAALYRELGAFNEAQADLNEALEIADPEMRLHLTDYHLESARLCLAMGGKHPEAQDHYEKAKKLVDETGYHRRDKELEELRAKLDQVLGA